MTVMYVVGIAIMVAMTMVVVMKVAPVLVADDRHARSTDLLLEIGPMDVQARPVSILRYDAREPVSHAPEF